MRKIAILLLSKLTMGENFKLRDLKSLWKTWNKKLFFNS